MPASAPLRRTRCSAIQSQAGRQKSGDLLSRCSSRQCASDAVSLGSGGNRSAVISEVDSNEQPEHKQDSDDHQGDCHDREQAQGPAPLRFRYRPRGTLGGGRSLAGWNRGVQWGLDDLGAVRTATRKRLRRR